MSFPPRSLLALIRIMRDGLVVEILFALSHAACVRSWLMLVLVWRIRILVLYSVRDVLLDNHLIAFAAACDAAVISGAGFFLLVDGIGGAIVGQPTIGTSCLASFPPAVWAVFDGFVDVHISVVPGPVDARGHHAFVVAIAKVVPIR